MTRKSEPWPWRNPITAADDIDLYMQGGLLVPRNAASALANAERELSAVRDLMFELIDRGIYVVRGNGSGQNPRT